MSIDKSPKLIFNEFQRSISEVPLEVYYQRLTADQYNSNGFQFNIKQPGTRALLDTDIWIKYTIPVMETEDWSIRNALLDANNGTKVPQNANRFAFRSGYCMWRALQNFSVQINNQTLTVQPYKYADILNRLYVSNDQSEHEFTTSGGCFDSGNHGCKTGHCYYYNWYPTQDINDTDQPGSKLPTDYEFTVDAGAGNTHLDFYVIDGFFPNQPATTNVNTDLRTNMRRVYANQYEFWNPGYGRRFEQFIMKLLDASSPANGPERAAAQGDQFDSGQNTGEADQDWWRIELYERLPSTLFKMYSNDGVFGVIPNITQMQLQGNFLSNIDENILRASNEVEVMDGSTGSHTWNGTRVDTTTSFLGLYWNGLTGSNNTDCQLFLKWYTPPMNMPIPRELSIPYPKIVTWSQSVDLPEPIYNRSYANKPDVNNYNITLESIPDLLLIYVKRRATDYTIYSPDDYLMEIVEININIDNASVKMNQMSTLDLYNKWKKILKHSDAKITGFTEWRKFCCVAALQPEDYGVRYGPGYSNQTVLGVKLSINNWHNLPTNNNCYPELYPDTEGELIVTSIYNRNRLILRDDGSAAQEMVKVAADFNVISNMGQMNEMIEQRGRLNL